MINESSPQEDGGSKLASGNDTKCSHPNWMRYMPNPPWKQSANLNLQLRDEKEFDKKVMGVKTTERFVSVTDSDNEGKEIQDIVETSSEEWEDASFVDKDEEQDDDDNKRPSKRPRSQCESTKRKIVSSNPFSTSHIVLAQVSLQDIVKTDPNLSSHLSCKKRCRLYNFNEEASLDDTAALLSFCKFKK